ncbi:MAG: HIT family protein [Phycisphaerae bacterium]|nr:HIT family protein [Phycisphaerae bacterium]
MAEKTCVFCSIVAGEIPCVKVYEDASVLAFLDVAPVSEGHTLVIPKRHFETLDQCPADVLSEIMVCAGKLARAVVAAADADGYNALCNNGKAAGQVVGHVHLHVIPRCAGDGIFARWPAGKYGLGRAEDIAAKIREKL